MPHATSIRPALAAACLLLAAAVAAVAAPSVANAVPATGIGGATRYDTAAAISRSAFPTGAPAAVIANSNAWADALGGSALAGAAGGPVLLATRDSLPAPIATELARLAPTQVYLLGGEGSLSATAQARVASLLPSATITRIGAPNRYDVAELVAQEVKRLRGSTPEIAFVVTGSNFPDALSCSAPAYARKWPILLIDQAHPTRISGVAQRVGVPRVVAVGGSGSIRHPSVGALTSAYPGTAFDWLPASDRYGASIAVANYVMASSTVGFDLANPTLASGLVPGDALAGAPLAAKRRSPLLLTAQAAQPESIGNYLFAHRAEVASYAFLGGTGTLPNGVRAEAQHALKAPPFSTGRAMEHIRVIAGYGPRRAGGTAERKTADYVAAQLRSYGYTVTIQTVTLPGGLTSRNVIAEKPGTSSQVLVIGGHMDTKYPSPGANDNASGVAVTLETARVMAQAGGVVPTIRYIGFAAEEIAGATPSDHHFGSRQYVASLSSAGKARIESMISVDMVGYGTVFNVRNLQKAPMTTVTSLRNWGSYSNQALPFLKDFGRSGWSDHEAFEFAGIPVAWLEWREDPVYHTTRDTYGHVQSDRIARTGRLLRGWVLNLTPTNFEALR